MRVWANPLTQPSEEEEGEEEGEGEECIECDEEARAFCLALPLVRDQIKALSRQRLPKAPRLPPVPQGRARMRVREGLLLLLPLAVRVISEIGEFHEL